MMQPSTYGLPRRISGLNELAHNLWWSWHVEARNLFKSLDRPLWKATGHNPVKLLRDVAPYRMVAAAEDPVFLATYDAVMREFESDMNGAGSWFRRRYPVHADGVIAYFSMEFAIHNSLPLYAGGLGVLAGDHCKEASDLGVPLVGVGLMYADGYFHQRVTDDGWQEEGYRRLDPHEAPIALVLSPQKRPIKVEVVLASRSVFALAWQVRVGRVNLYLLDTDVEENSGADRQLCARLYGGDREARLQQEIVLGIGGVRLLRALGVEPAAWHANEGHVAFMMLERCRELVAGAMGLADAVDQVRSTTVFTTHTPVPAGNDVFQNGLVHKYLGPYCNVPGLDTDSVLKLGNIGTESAGFNMTALGMRLAGHRNGVSQLHGEVCRRMWNCLWPGAETNEIPIRSLTNGIHVPTWVAPQMARLYETHLGRDWLLFHDDPALWSKIDNIPDDELWAARRWLRQKLVGALQDRARRRWEETRGAPLQALAAGALLDTEALTIGFSRRFTDYKRAALILQDPGRLKKILRDELRPVQIVFSGKAHPDDQNGKRLIQEICNLAKNPEFGGRIAFVEDYDLHMARYFVHGVDVWLNTPRPLHEASGTSGMKAAINGVPHLSVLDGWWYEGYDGTNGWAIGNGVPSDGAAQDKSDADCLYHLLEEKIVPLYYERDLNCIPHGWLTVVKRAIRSAATMFCARRMVKEYTEQMYVPACNAAAGCTDELQAAGSTSRASLFVPA